MKTVFTLLFYLSLSAFSAQTLHKKEAIRLIQKCDSCVKYSDSLCVYSLWDLSYPKWPYHKRPFSILDLREHFKELKKFLSVENDIQKALKGIEITKTPDELEGSNVYSIGVWFPISKREFKAVIFHVSRNENEWKFINPPEYTTLNK